MMTRNSSGGRGDEAWQKKTQREDNIFMAIVFLETVAVVAIINYVMVFQAP